MVTGIIVTPWIFVHPDRATYHSAVTTVVSCSTVSQFAPTPLNTTASRAVALCSDSTYTAAHHHSTLLSTPFLCYRQSIHHISMGGT
jgi:hypothetical protein